MKGTEVPAEMAASTVGERTKAARVSPGAAARKRAAIELVRSHGTALRGTARRYSICGDDADDAFQRGLEILLRKAPSGDPHQLLPWARTVIKHEALAVRRSRERILGRPATAAEEQDWVQLIPSRLDGPEERAAGREKVARSREALARLKPNELKALTQLAEGYSYAEIGAMNNWTRTKVNRCLAEGRERFRSAFRESEAGERCAEVEPLLSACCDGELDRARLAEAEDHLAVCGSCRATLRAYRAAPAAAAALAPALPLPGGIWERLQELAATLHARVQTVTGDPAGPLAGAAGTARGAVPAAVAKVAAVCAGTAGTAAVCVAAGVLPAPVIGSHPARTAKPPAEKAATRDGAVLPAAPAPMEARESTPGAGAGPEPSPGAEEKAEPKPPARREQPAVPVPRPTEAEFTPEAAGSPAAAGPPPPPAPPPQPARATGGGGGGVPVGGGGEFGP